MFSFCLRYKEIKQRETEWCNEDVFSLMLKLFIRLLTLVTLNIEKQLVKIVYLGWKKYFSLQKVKCVYLHHKPKMEVDSVYC